MHKKAFALILISAFFSLPDFFLCSAGADPINDADTNRLPPVPGISDGLPTTLPPPSADAADSSPPSVNHDARKPVNAANQATSSVTPANALPASINKAEPAQARVQLEKEKAIASPAKTSPAKTTFLYGRIEELVNTKGAKFPIQLKAMTAQMDLRGSTNLHGSSAASIFSGSLVRSFPAELQGVWGGTLQLMQIQFDNSFWQLEPAEAKQLSELLPVGARGQVNFQFANFGGKVTLEPANIFFQAPMTASRYGEMMKQMNGGTVNLPGLGPIPPGMAPMFQQIMRSMPYMFAVGLGETQGTGVSGNSVRATLLRNVIHQLSANVLEEQIVTQDSETNPTTGRTERGYSETVVRFTRYNNTQQYVQTASVHYGANKQFLHKMVFAGYITRGHSEQVNPMGDLQKLFPGGMNPLAPSSGNPFKGLFGQ